MNFLKRNVHQHTVNEINHLSGTPSPSFWSKWFGGVIVPVCILIYGLRCCISQKAVFFGRHGSHLELSGILAIFMGFAWLSGAFFLHFHYFWSSIKRLCVFADFGKSLSLICLLGTFGYVIWSILI
ncbi:MAG: hypothetical protein KOO69_08440 [Victivallales bacterium]|nr:hypothetical protein [Victivallales bacterium]